MKKIFEIVKKIFLSKKDKNMIYANESVNRCDESKDKCISKEKEKKIYCYSNGGEVLTMSQYVQRIKEQLYNGEDPNDLFCDVTDYVNGFAKVKIYEKGWNYITSEHKILWDGDAWFTECDDFENGYAAIYIHGMGWNFLSTNGVLLWKGDKWFNECYAFKNEFAAVMYIGTWYHITKDGNLLSKEQYIPIVEQCLANGEDPNNLFDDINNFVDGFAIVFIEEKGTNLLKQDGTLLWKGDTWFNNCHNFCEGFSLIYIEEKGYNFLDTDGTLLWKGDKWFEDGNDFENGFAIISLCGKGYNFINPNGTLLWSDDTWFDSCGNFKNGFARVKYNGEWYRLSKGGDLLSNEQYIHQIKQHISDGEEPTKIVDFVGEFFNGLAKVEIKGIGYNFLKTDGTFLWNGDKWFDYSLGFKNGFARVWIYGKGYNFLKEDGTLLWSGDTWFDECENFKDGFAKVTIDGIGLNFLKTDGTLVWDSDTWLDNCYSFYEGFARVQYKGDWCRLTQNGDLISKEQYIQQIKQHLANGENPKNIFNEVGDFENEFAIVRLNGIGWNFLKPDGTLLWPGDTWFDWCDDFKDGFARVRINGKGENFLKTDGELLWKGDKWFGYCSWFNNGLATVTYKDKIYNINTEGALLLNREK